MEFFKDELYGLTCQIWWGNASVSVNIEESWAETDMLDYLTLLKIEIDFAMNRNSIEFWVAIWALSPSEHVQISDITTEIKIMITPFIQTLKNLTGKQKVNCRHVR